MAGVRIHLQPPEVSEERKSRVRSAHGSRGARHTLHPVSACSLQFILPPFPSGQKWKTRCDIIASSVQSYVTAGALTLTAEGHGGA